MQLDSCLTVCTPIEFALQLRFTELRVYPENLASVEKPYLILTTRLHIFYPLRSEYPYFLSPHSLANFIVKCLKFKL